MCEIAQLKARILHIAYHSSACVIPTEYWHVTRSRGCLICLFTRKVRFLCIRGGRNVVCRAWNVSSDMCNPLFYWVEMVDIAVTIVLYAGENRSDRGYFMIVRKCCQKRKNMQIMNLLMLIIYKFVKYCLLPRLISILTDIFMPNLKYTTY